MTDDSISTLRTMVADCPPIRLKPAGLFVAHCGVLTIVFEGFDTCILAMKDRVHRAFPSLEEEHEGSLWPKVTLAVLKDWKRLTEAEVGRLRTVADEWKEAICSPENEIEINELLAVEYGCRNLEVRRRTEVLPLQGGPADPTPPPHHARYVRSVLGQFTRDRIQEYTALIDREGNRETHYRESAHGWSLVADVAEEQLRFAPQILESVDSVTPGKYCPFAPASWHVTVRSLDHATE
jgi:hypothetical protein